MVYLLETKKRADLDSAEVLAEKQAAVAWCARRARAGGYSGKPWRYALIPHDHVS